MVNLNIKIGFSILSKYKFYYFLAIIASIISALLLCFSPLLIGKLIDNISSKNLTENFNLVYILIGCYFFSLLLQSISEFTTSTMSEKMGHFLRERILDKILQIESKESTYTEKFDNGEMISLFGRDIDSIWDMFGFGITNFISSLLLIISFCCIVFYINIYIGFLLIIISILFIISFYYNGKSVRSDFSKAAPEYDKMQNFYSSVLSGLLTIFSFNIRFWIKNKVLIHSEKTVKLANSAHKKSVYFTFLTGFINLLALLFIWIYFIYQFPSNNIRIGEFVSILFYFNMVTKPLEQIGESSKSFNKGYVSLLRIEKFINNENLIKFNKINNEYKSSEYLDIYVNKLSIDKKILLKNIKINIPKKIIIGIAGESGSGKTTLLKAIAKLNEGNLDGNIFINNCSIFNMNEDVLRSTIGFLPQFSDFFPITLEDNIYLNNNKIDLTDLISKLNLSKVFSNSRFTDLNNLGLSGGEKQRLSLLRFFIRNYSLLLLDEPTSSLDKYNRNSVIEILIGLKTKNKTIIISSHDESILKECDLIYFIENGNLIDSGTHNTLFIKNDKYVKMLSKRSIDEN